MPSQTERAKAFRVFHDGPSILVLANAWDTASAKIFELAGAKAVATTSSGIAQTRGYSDGNRMPRDVAVAAVAQIAGVLDLPLTADIEAGYGRSPEDVAETARQVWEAGAVGINLEDNAGDAGLLADKIRAIRSAGIGGDTPLFINARTDFYLYGKEGAHEESIRRGRIYAEAGADSLFVPGISREDHIRATSDGVGLPLNVLVFPGVPAPAVLERWGVRRVSVGGGIMHGALGYIRRSAQALLEEGRYESFLTDAVSHGEANAWFMKE
jgi:2-methylisocitrate lyase-like PEP mutase family enzyme